MGSWWRSEEMTYMSLIVSEEAAPACIKELGSLGCFQFIDLNHELTPFQRRYVSYIKRYDEIERKIRYIYDEIKKMDIPVLPAGSIDVFIERSLDTDSSGANMLQVLENKLDLYEKQLVDLNKYSHKLTEEFAHKVEFYHLVNKTLKFIKNATDVSNAYNDASDDEHDVIPSSSSFAAKYSSMEIETNPMRSSPSYALPDEAASYQVHEMAFSNIAGVIATSEQQRFDRMLYRATRGNCYVKFKQLSDNAVDAFGKAISKTCFIIFYKSNVIEIKIKKICDAFGANRYDVGHLNRPHEIEQQKQETLREIDEAKRVITQNYESRMRLCVEVAQHIEEWLWIVRREKTTYHTLNLFKSDVAGNSVLRGRGWMLEDSKVEAIAAIRRAHVNMNLSETALFERVSRHEWLTPPTHFHTNKFTVAFQSFVNTYGTPRYKEINPALFTAATFPFLFGVMYGDIGHGSCLALGGLYLIVTEYAAEARSTSSMLKDIYVARYMVFAMGLMGIYAGLVYNDYFSLGLNLFGSKWNFVSDESGSVAIQDGSYGSSASVYPFGVDPIWKISTNELLFFNSMKMKMSVILGILQMTFGILLRGINTIYFKSWIDFYCEFLPMIIFDVLFFGYMVVLIFVKWSINWDERMALGSCGYDEGGILGNCNLSYSTSCYTSTGDVCTSSTTLIDLCPLGYGGTSNGCQPPNLITTLINIALKPGTVEEPMYAGQAGMQTFILIVAFICVPWLLLAKPIYLNHTHKRQRRNSNASEECLVDHGDSDSTKLIKKSAAGADNESHGGGHGDEHGDFNIGEIAIHQAIETIEFVLGMVSNTASYLRLWALSLAHTELATVFWEKAMLSMIETNNPVLIFLGYGIFAAVTFGVLLCMDVLECFLHALRLHWVEFQNKFYKADGYEFKPFDFKITLKNAILE